MTITVEKMIECLQKFLISKLRLKKLVLINF